MKKFLICFVLFLASFDAQAQEPSYAPWVRRGDGIMTGTLKFASYASGSEPVSCSSANAGKTVYNTSTSKLRFCNGSAWTDVVSGSVSFSFADLTSGTNSAAAMIVGTGGSLTVSGSGTINATTLLGSTWASPGAIGTGTPDGATFTTVTAGGTRAQVWAGDSSYGAWHHSSLTGSTDYALVQNGSGATILNAASGQSLLFRIANSTQLTLTSTSLTFSSAKTLKFSTASGITASTTQTQGQGGLANDVNQVSTVANTNDVVTLPVASTGRTCVVINDGAQTLQVYPASGDNLGAGLNTSTTIAAGAAKRFVSWDNDNWKQI